ncbi:MAG: FtsX-like permease family protein [Spirochaetaceae bacterium]|nr:FtsX-like permease family protein [Spirochaetaceae bacterium]MCF7952313.1 FtsX-like permease family protein [Spirochaetaceae bacterium]
MHKMIFLRILKKDFLRKKGIMLIVFSFILLSAFLMSAGANLIVELSNSLNALFSASRAPHFVQMHAGSIDQPTLNGWARKNKMVEEFQLVEMITIDGSALFLGDSGVSEESSVMDIGFVSQNETFDYLLDMQNRPLQVSPGEIAVPVYYLQNRDLQLGDTLRVKGASQTTSLTITAFLRDAQMNPSIVHSKRFLLHQSDYTELQKQFTESEYLIEFILTDPGRIDEFTKAYLDSGLPKMGPTVDSRLFKTLNALTDGIVAAVVIVLSLLIMIIALLCLRFTILATLEDDYREIGVMKAVGMKRGDIKRIYLFKYFALGALAALLGYLASLSFNRILSEDILLYIGSAPKSFVQHLIPLCAAALTFLIVLLSTVLILRRLNRISAVEALRAGAGAGIGGKASAGVRILPLKNSKLFNVNVFLGMRDVFQRFRMFALLGFIFFFCTFIIILPVHFLGTITSPSFISYMGIGRSDIRVDLRQSESVAARFADMLEYIEADDDVERFSPLITSQFTMLSDNGEKETIAIESGDFTLFPLDYVKGGAPARENEIALSYLKAKDMNRKIGDSLSLMVDGSPREMTVCGIYQDVTNGGRTAKTILPYNPAKVLWYTVSLDLAAQADMQAKMHEYSDQFHPARITDMESYIDQTLGSTIDQLGRVTLVAIAAGLVVSILITSLFLKMIISKDSSQIAIMKSIGFSLQHIRIQYLSNTLVLLAIGLLLGTVFSNTLGQRFVSILWSQMGASQITFIIDPLRAYILMPLLLMGTVSLATVLSISAIKEHSIINGVKE